MRSLGWWSNAGTITTPEKALFPAKATNHHGNPGLDGRSCGVFLFFHLKSYFSIDLMTGNRLGKLYYKFSNFVKNH
jgi:hypothetical protein